MSATESKVIGYIASETRIKVICTDVDVCLIAGSKEEMSRYLIELENESLAILCHVVYEALGERHKLPDIGKMDDLFVHACISSKTAYFIE